jgi:hypothetical protein
MLEALKEDLKVVQTVRGLILSKLAPQAFQKAQAQAPETTQAPEKAKPAWGFWITVLAIGLLVVITVLSV